MLEMTEQRRDGATLLELKGRLDSDGAKALEGRLTALIAAGATRLVLDLEQLDYISSLGLRAILMAAKAAFAAKGKLVLCRPNAMVRRLFDVGFANVFEIYDTREAALARVK